MLSLYGFLVELLLGQTNVNELTDIQTILSSIFKMSYGKKKIFNEYLVSSFYFNLQQKNVFFFWRQNMEGDFVTFYSCSLRDLSKKHEFRRSKKRYL